MASSKLRATGREWRPSPVLLKCVLRRRSGIQRTHLQPTEVIRANVSEGVLPDDVVKNAGLVETQTLHPAVTVSFRGTMRSKRSPKGLLWQHSAWRCFYVVLLVTQFNSFYQPALILFSVVLSTTGVFIGLLVTGNPFIRYPASVSLRWRNCGE